MTRTFGLGIALAALLGFATVGQAAPVSPDAGIYVMVSRTTAVGRGCTDPLHNTGFGTFHYPGHNLLGTLIYVPKTNHFAVDVYTLPRTPNLGVTSWAGRFIKKERPGNTSVRGTFTATLTFIDRSSFLVDITTDESDTGCVEENQLTLLKMS